MNLNDWPLGTDGASMAPTVEELRVNGFNQFVVRRADRSIIVLAPPKPGERITRDEALAFAAWLVKEADPGLVRFAEVLEQIRGIGT